MKFLAILIVALSFANCKARNSSSDTLDIDGPKKAPVKSYKDVKINIDPWISKLVPFGLKDIIGVCFRYYEQVESDATVSARFIDLYFDGCKSSAPNLTVRLQKSCEDGCNLMWNDSTPVGYINHDQSYSILDLCTGEYSKACTVHIAKDGTGVIDGITIR